MTPGLALSVLAVTLKDFSVLDLMELFTQVVVELRMRGDAPSAELISTGAKSHARFAVTPEAPSDDGDRAPGDSGAAG